jgi:hypothetical protein
MTRHRKQSYVRVILATVICKQEMLETSNCTREKVKHGKRFCPPNFQRGCRCFGVLQTDAECYAFIIAMHITRYNTHNIRGVRFLSQPSFLLAVALFFTLFVLCRQPSFLLGVSPLPCLQSALSVALASAQQSSLPLLVIIPLPCPCLHSSTSLLALCPLPLSYLHSALFTTLASLQPSSFPLFAALSRALLRPRLH